MSLIGTIKEHAQAAIKELYQIDLTAEQLTVNETKPEFEGDYTLVLFSLVKQTKKSPDTLGEELGKYLTEKHAHFFNAFNVIKGFLNLSIVDAPLINLLQTNFDNANFGQAASNGKRVLVEYSSPNTNKPLHLGHLRNNFLGWSVSAILQSAGYDVIKTCIVNDRGIHICKSMIAWQRYANGATPETTNTKGDHFVGDYYVKFNDAYKLEVAELVAGGMEQKKAEQEAPIMQATQQMLQDWEAGKPEVMDLWKRMNGWVYAGFDETYKKIGSDFDKIYYESETYLLGKKTVQEGLAKGVFNKRDDGSVWIDLTADGQDEKLVLRKDGTSVYITQDIGLAQQRYEQYKYDENIYVIGDEQNYHMQVLKLICQKLGMPNANGIYHLSYGMVELPTGKMKSREGTVVDADDLVAEMIENAKEETSKNGKADALPADEQQKLFELLGLGAMKFFLLKVEPKKKMVFNPAESIDFHGFTAPYIQYTHARIKSILRDHALEAHATFSADLLSLEKELLLKLETYPTVVLEAAGLHSPSLIANYVFQLSQIFNGFYNKHHIAKAESDEKKQLRLHLCQMMCHVLKNGMKLLGIDVPERM
jgi:arginyl-tRNA synthetase